MEHKLQLVEDLLSATLQILARVDDILRLLEVEEKDIKILQEHLSNARNALNKAIDFVDWQIDPRYGIPTEFQRSKRN